MTTKVCTKCGVEKPLGEYYKDRRAKDGAYSECKSCSYERTKQYAKANPEKGKKARLSWKTKNPERVKEIKRRHYLNNSEKAKEGTRKWKIKNIEAVKEYSQEWVRNNPEKMRENARRYRLNNPERYKKMNRIKAQRNVEELSGSYVKGIIKKLYNIDADDITPETIEMKRRSIKYYRELNQLKKLTK